jgi:CO/xanthine dehydrogenase FAD-binding subunit
MRAYLPAYELKTPANLAEALNLLASSAEGWKPFAGGTDLMVLLEAGNLPAGRYLSLWHLQELRGIQETSQHLTLGALTTFAELQRHPTLQREYSLLCQAAGVTGAVAIQNRATLGGNIANASPAADSLPRCWFMMLTWSCSRPAVIDGCRITLSTRATRKHSCSLES